MERTLLKALKTWKNGSERKPLILRGARQVGKTWLLKEFARTEYQSCAYVNFDQNERMQRLFSSDLRPARILEGLQIECRRAIIPGETFIIFDEVQEVPQALASLKYFYEETPDYHIATAGSLLGVALHPGTSFPVGKVSFLDLRPLSFMEFLMAMGDSNLAELIERRDWPLLSTFKNQFLQRLREYVFTGGMPEVVAGYAARHDVIEVRQTQQRILDAYEQDFSKHAPISSVPRIRLLWRSIPGQLARENRKFVYGAVKPGARAREYELAMAWLADCGLIHRINRVTKPGLPLRAYEDYSSFKLFLLDVGLLAALCRVDAVTLLEGSRIFEEFKGALTEQFVLQELRTLDDLDIHYWSADASTAEVDFVVQENGAVWPLEVKAGENLQSKSLKVYRDRYDPPLCLRTSLSDFREQDWLCNIPLYAIDTLPMYCVNSRSRNKEKG
jgi:predicted AAA+ superfamily ATPase